MTHLPCLPLPAEKEKKKLDLEAEGALVDAEQESEALGSWEESDRDYTYEELLDRVYGILRERNPELTGEKKRTILKPPEVRRRCAGGLRQGPRKPQSRSGRS